MPENASDLPTTGNDEPMPVTASAQAVPVPPPTGASAAAPRLRDRVFRLRSVLAVAAAGVIVGGAAGAGLTALPYGHGESRPQFGRNGFGPGQAPGRSGGLPGMPGGQGALPGQGMPTPPAQTPPA